MKFFVCNFVPLLIAAASLDAKHCRVGDKCNQCKVQLTEGQYCLEERTADVVEHLTCNSFSGIIEASDRKYLHCNEQETIWRLVTCPDVDGAATYFDGRTGCVDPIGHAHRQAAIAGSGRIGDYCIFNTDCLGGMYCSSGRCSCLSTNVAIDGYCYEKIGPGDLGCTHNQQCSAVWPDATCDQGDGGRCACPNYNNVIAYVAAPTRDGNVCILKSNAPLCPLPDPGGQNLILANFYGPLATVPSIVACKTTASDTTTSQAGSITNPLYGQSWCVYLDPTTGNDVYIADIYDCILSSAVINQPAPPNNFAAPGADGLCCPNRAFTCIQPKESCSSVTATEPRWWYNSITGTCEEFLWDSTCTIRQSPNNFRTLDHCESYCRDTCPRSAPQYNTNTPYINERPVTACSGSSSCAATYQCTTVGSSSLCCQTNANICSNIGARPLDTSSSTRGTIYDSGYPFIVPASVGTFPLSSQYPLEKRYYYDNTAGKCLEFTYQGMFGNYNNFFSKSDCESFCASLQCDYGQPIVIGDSPQQCQSNSDCPSSYSCQADQKVCCPRPQTLCTEPKRVGDCAQSVKRYWYNANTKACELFDYTGCQGNDNNFPTLLGCQTFCKNISPEPNCPQGQAYTDSSGIYTQCSTTGQGSTCPINYYCYYDGFRYGCCPSKAFTCSLQSDQGVQCGSGTSFRYFFNAQTEQCESFLFQGCDGNSNNFPTLMQCEDYCGVGGCPNGGAPYRDPNTGQITSCSANAPCPTTHECSTVISGFSSVRRCCPTKAYICGLPPQTGTQCGGSTQLRYYFNIVTTECTQFTFNGCDPNLNNFASSAECEDFCLSAGCDPGDAVFVDPSSNSPLACNPALQNSCPINYECTFDILTSGNVCCGATDMGVCPVGEKAYVEARDLTVRECVINIEGSCPLGYLCRFNFQKNRYYCCASLSGSFCPGGRALYRDPNTLAPTQCNLGATNTYNVCADGYSCQSDISNAFQGYCCTTGPVCPNAANFYVDPSTQMPVKCVVGPFSSCPNGFSCQVQPSKMTAYCCAGQVTGVQDGCPPNEYVYTQNGLIVNCDPFNPPNAPCPLTYSCQWSLTNQRYQCCGSVPITQPQQSDGCPDQQVAYLTSLNNSPQVCTSAAPNACPLGYFCQYSTVNNQFQCCGISAGCPNKQVAFVGVDGNAEACVPSISVCQFGFTCQKTTKGNAVCCTNGFGGGPTQQQCTTNQVFVNGQCLPRSEPYGPCQSSLQCLGGSVCVSRQCQCPVGSVVAGNVCQRASTASSRKETNSTAVKVTAAKRKKVSIGQPCTSTSQCSGNSACINAVCQCSVGQVRQGDKCVPDIIVALDACPISGELPYTDAKTLNVRYCTQNSRDECPPNYSCQYSSQIEQTLCCGKEDDDNTLIDIDEEEESYYEVCAMGSSPYMVNGRPKTCMGTGCPAGFRCTYSTNGRNYFCCSSGWENMIETEFSMDGCPRGRALLYPQTETPVECEIGSRPCPSGYDCVRSTITPYNQCCTQGNSRRRLSMRQRYKEFGRRDIGISDNFTRRRAKSTRTNTTTNNPITTITIPEFECPSYLVLVERTINDKTVRRCETTCPSHQIPIHGVCRDHAFHFNDQNTDQSDEL